MLRTGSQVWLKWCPDRGTWISAARVLRTTGQIGAVQNTTVAHLQLPHMPARPPSSFGRVWAASCLRAVDGSLRRDTALRAIGCVLPCRMLIPDTWQSDVVVLVATHRCCSGQPLRHGW